MITRASEADQAARQTHARRRHPQTRRGRDLRIDMARGAPAVGPRVTPKGDGGAPSSRGARARWRVDGRRHGV